MAKKENGSIGTGILIGVGIALTILLIVLIVMMQHPANNYTYQSNSSLLSTGSKSHP